MQLNKKQCHIINKHDINIVKLRKIYYENKDYKN